MEFTLTPTKITAWLDCQYSLTLRRLLEQGSPDVERSHPGEMAHMLQEKGVLHEKEVLEGFRKQGFSVVEVPPMPEGSSFDKWSQQQLSLLDEGHEVLYQMPLSHEGVRGVADFLLKVPLVGGGFTYEPIDAKLARASAKPGHILQLCFYAEAIYAHTGVRPQRIHVALGSAKTESFELHQFDAYWRRVREELRVALNDEPKVSPESPEPCRHCDICELSPTCISRWRNEDSLAFLAGSSLTDRRSLQAVGLNSLGQLACAENGSSLTQQRFERLQSQAQLQIRRRENGADPLPFQAILPTDESIWGRGLDDLPSPSEGDIFFDLEGHPYFQPSSGLFFLFGCLIREADSWGYRAWRADSAEQEKQAADEVLEFFEEQRRCFPSMHIYHYNHTERSALATLSEGRPSKLLFQGLVEGGLFVDLLPIFKNSFQIGAESYGLKSVEKLTGFIRRALIDEGSGAVLEYDKFLRDGDESHIEAIKAYNEDDVRATKAVRDWLLDHRSPELAWPTTPSPDDEVTEHEMAERERLLLEFPSGSAENTVGLLLNYWWRELTALKEPLFAQASGELQDALDDPSVIADLSLIDVVGRPNKNQPDETVWEAIFRYPAQSLADDIGSHDSAVLVTGRIRGGIAGVIDIDSEQRTVRLRWRDPDDEHARQLPTSIAPYTWVREAGKLRAIVLIADLLLGRIPGRQISGLTRSLLTNAPPTFQGGFSLPEQGFSPALEEMKQWSTQLTESALPIQGPPGTGKTFSGAHLAHQLIRQGRRVGIMSNSHDAISNFLRQTRSIFYSSGDGTLFSARHHGDASKVSEVDGVLVTKSVAKKNLPSAFSLIAGTAWFFSDPTTYDTPVDVLIIDEASQVSFADAIAASLSAKAVILLGDPQQLAQVQNASHPDLIEQSVLGYRLRGLATIPSTEGVFLSTSRRMHPAICKFISEQFYESRLRPSDGCDLHTIEGFQAGLHWLEASHSQRTTHAPEEIELVASEIRMLVGKVWHDYDHEKEAVESRVLRPSDFMVVVPFNHQRRQFEQAFSSDPLLQGVRVGTVDKFQGQEAPVVFYSMTTSSKDDVSRGLQFLLSARRFNVAVSRAKCLAYVVCTRSLLNATASNIEEMRLISMLNSFVEDSSHI